MESSSDNGNNGKDDKSGRTVQYAGLSRRPFQKPPCPRLDILFHYSEKEIANYRTYGTDIAICSRDQ